MRKALGPNGAEGTFFEVRNRVCKSGPSRPSKSKRANDETSEKGGPTPSKEFQGVVNGAEGGVHGEVLQEPSGGPDVEQLGERLRVQNRMKNKKGFFLGLPRGLQKAGH